MKQVLTLLFILFPNVAFSDPMNVEEDWELLEESYSSELFSSDKNYKLYLTNNEELNILNNNTNEECTLATIKDLENISQEKNEKIKHVYRFFYLDDGSVHIFNYYKHFIFENVDSIFEYKCSKYYLGDITVKNYNGRIKGVIKSCFKEESWGEDFNNRTTKKFKNTFLVMQTNSYAFSVGRIDASEDTNKLILDRNGVFLGSFPSVNHVLGFCDVYEQIIFKQ